MNRSKVKTRDTNIELLRIISILLIICFHYVYKSQFEYQVLNIHTLSVKTFWLFGELGVNLFILITGYYLINSKFSFKKFILLVFEVLFYNILLYLIANIINGTPLDPSLIFPIITSKYWFVTAYLLIYILSPFYNILIKSMKKKKYQKFLLIGLLLWSIIPTIFGFIYNTSENVMFYNRFIWLSFMYFVGAYIREYKIKFLTNKKTNILTIGITFFTMILSIIVIYLFKDLFMKIGTTEIAYFWTPNNILMFILSISIFYFFINLKIKNNKIINTVASTTLGIYLLHDGHLTNYLWHHLFHTNTLIYSNYYIFYILSATITIFIIGVLLDLIRQIIEKNTIKKLINLKIWEQLYIKMKIEIINIIDSIL